jgi:hypothetical protein
MSDRRHAPLVLARIWRVHLIALLLPPRGEGPVMAVRLHVYCTASFSP